jgi:sulfur carrier protein
MKTIVNGKEIDTKENITVLELLKELKIEDKVMAVAINMEIVKKDNWSTHTILELDQIELLHFVGGG